MDSLARIYRIPSSLRIATARLREILPVVHVSEGGGSALAVVTAVTFSARVHGPDNERAHIVWLADTVSARCGAWQVTARRDRATWVHAGAVVTVTSGGMSATGGSDARLARAMRVVERRAAQLAEALAALDWRMTCDVVATGADEVLVALYAHECPALAQVERAIRALWPTTQQDAATGAALRNYPTDPNDARLLEAGLSLENRELIAAVNRGETAAQIALALTGDRDPFKANELNQRIYRLRKRHPELILPARRKRV